MSLDPQSLIVSSVVGVNVFLVAFFVYALSSSQSSRNRPLWKLVGTYGLVSTVSIIIFYLTTSAPSVLNLSTGVFYLLVAAFVFTIEVPGYIQLRRFDERILTYLEDWRNEMVTLGYDFNQYESLRSNSSKGVGLLKEVNLNRLVNDFIEHCGRMKNLDKPFWALVLGEVQRVIDEVQERSKHPAPKLIELLSLSGLSFIIALLLRALG